MIRGCHANINAKTGGRLNLSLLSNLLQAPTCLVLTLWYQSGRSKSPVQSPLGCLFAFTQDGDLLLIVKYIDSFLSGCSPTNERVGGGCWLQRWRRRIGDLIRTWCIYSGELIRQEQSSCCLCLLQGGDTRTNQFKRHRLLAESN